MKKIKQFATVLFLLSILSCSTNNDSNGDTSNTTVVPIAPSNLIGSAISTSEINLSWTDNSTNETGFKIERRTGTGNYAIVGTVDEDGLTFSDTGLTPSTSYTYRVYSYNTAGKSPTYSNELILTTNNVITLPTVNTGSITDITANTAYSGGIISSDGGAPITAKGVCWSTSVSPSIALNTKTNNGSGTGFFSSYIYGLTANTTYYVRSYATNSLGTAYGNEIIFKTSLAIGLSYQGGKIAYILQPGDPGYIAGEQHGLIAALTEQSTYAYWYNNYTYISTGASGTAIGTGQSNTTIIVNTLGPPSYNYAAKLCDDYTSGGYSDWFLPSKDELNKLYISRQYIGMNYITYWSSSQYSSNSAWRLYLVDGVLNHFTMNGQSAVRAVRKF